MASCPWLSDYDHGSGISSDKALSVESGRVSLREKRELLLFGPRPEHSPVVRSFLLLLLVSRSLRCSFSALLGPVAEASGAEGTTGYRGDSFSPISAC